jgi:hypothetical protein
MLLYEDILTGDEVASDAFPTYAAILPLYSTLILQLFWAALGVVDCPIP